MSSIGNLQFDDIVFGLEEANIYGIVEAYGDVTWHVEMFPEGEENYIMLNALVFDGIYSPKNLSNITGNKTADLYEHTVIVNGKDRFLKTFQMTFGEWNTEDGSILLRGYGIVEAADDSPELNYNFNAILKFKELNIFETTPEETQQFIDTYLADIKSDISATYQQVASGLQARITGRF